MADIGDMDMQREIPVGQAFDPHGIIVIAGCLAVDGDDVVLTEVLAALNLLLGNFRRNGGGLLQNGRRKFVGDVELPDGDFNIDSKVVRMAENLNDSPDRMSSVVGKLKNFHVDDEAVEIFGTIYLDRLHSDAIRRLAGRRHLHSVGYLDPLLNAVFARFDEVAFRADPERADHRLVRSFQDVDNLAVRLAAVLDTADLHDDTITVHGGFGGTLGDVDVALDPLDREV